MYSAIYWKLLNNIKIKIRQKHLYKAHQREVFGGIIYNQFIVSYAKILYRPIFIGISPRQIS